MADEEKGNKRLSSSPSEDEPESKKKVSSTSAENDWNAEECRGDHESEEHWDLRKQFLLQNMGRFPKPRLICLSQVFANMEFLGCRYPDETMELVHELSLGIVEDYREKQKTRLQRTFVKASDAAERKTKGI
ncbi:unnamed protein product [Orchesella dallaii]|uniref:XRN2-binding (XTBD) domain-containing protein n=1 Tax=Orchesella dallaii TaxID=48710 RepID=A0ABP1QB30_9HEXA